MVGGPKTPQQIAAQKRLQQSQAQVDEVRSVLCKPLKRTHYFDFFFFYSGGGHYENERDESAGQGSKTVRTGRQSRFLNRFHNDANISRMCNLLYLCVSKTSNVTNCIKLSYFIVFFQIEIKLILRFICQYNY